MKIYKKLVVSVFIILTSICLFLNSRDIVSASEILSEWSITLPIPIPLASHTLNIIGNTIFLIGGGGSGDGVNTHIAEGGPTSNGTINSWVDTLFFPSPRIWHSSAQNNLGVYILGGYYNNNSINTIEFSPIGEFPTTWQQLTPLPELLDRGGVVIIDNKIYYAGGTKHVGNNNVTLLNDKIWSAEINDNGTIGNWQLAGTLPTTLNEFGMIATSNNRFIVAGGAEGNTSTPTDKVYECSADSSTGTVSCVTTYSLPEALRRFGTTKVGDYIIVAGGAATSGFSNNVYYTEIDSNGSIGNWTTSTHPLPNSICCGALAATNSYLYYTGGVIVGRGYVNDVYFDSLNLPSPTPTPTPTPIPLPNLNVPDLKQYSEPWKTQIYDNANNWAANPYIKNWGCALTSASMVLKYYGYDINPGDLNTWLKNQSDGYLRNGLINWLAVSRYSFQNKSESGAALEFLKLAPTEENLISELTAGRPPILKEPGHFIVAKSQIDNSFGINDPAYDNRPTLASYNNSFSSIYSYIPSNTDLSYILLTLNSNYNIQVHDPNGNLITGYTFDEEPLKDDSGEGVSGETLTVFAYPKPDNGSYKISVSGPEGQYTLNSYTYNENGDIIDQNTTTTAAEELHLNYDSDPETTPLEIIDHTPPVITSNLSPSPNADGWNNSDTTLTWDISDPETSTTSASGCGASIIDTETPAITYACSAESAGGIATKSATIKLDKTLPSIPFLVSPANNGYVNTLNPTLVWSSSNDELSGLKEKNTYRYQVATDTNFSNKIHDGYTSNTNYTPSLKSDGTYYWRIYARDAADNPSNFSQVRKFTVDTSSPTTPGTPITTTPAYSTTQVWSWTASSDNISESLQYIWRVIESIGGTTIDTGVTTNLTAGTWSFLVKAQDLAGNTSEESQGKVLVEPAAVISNQKNTAPSTTEALITWETDHSATSRVVYDIISHSSLGAAPNYGYAYSTPTANTNPKVTSHSVTLSGLTPGQTYYYRSISEGSPVSISEENSFQTLSEAGPPPPATSKKSKPTPEESVSLAASSQTPVVAEVQTTNQLQEKKTEVLGKET